MLSWLFPSAKKRAANIDHENRQDLLVMISRDAVISAATATADVASEVTTILKNKLDESLRQIEVTNRLIHDAVLTCSPDGSIMSTNRASDELFIDSPEYRFGGNITDLFCGFEGQPEALWDVIARRGRLKVKTGPVSAQMVRGSLARLTRYDGTPSILIIIHTCEDH